MGCLKVTVFRNVIRFREFFVRDVILLCLWWNTLYFLTRFRKLQCSWSCVSICGICNSRWNPVLKALSECDRLLCMCTLFSWLVDQSKCKSSLSCKFTFNFCTPSNKLTCIIMYVATWFNSLVYSLCVARRFCTSLKNIWSTHMLVGHFFKFSFLFHRRVLPFRVVSWKTVSWLYSGCSLSSGYINRSSFLTKEKYIKSVRTQSTFGIPSLLAIIFVLVRIHARSWLTLRNRRTSRILQAYTVICCVTWPTHLDPKFALMSPCQSTRKMHTDREEE